ncbi:MAG: biotin/lipoyl-binding protein [Bacteroidales bacterium]|nr:biotin/lipoyl-binding protein [Bacteroidales bacterium]
MKEYKFTIGGKKYEVAVSGIEGNVADVSVNGVAYKVEIEEGAAPAAVSAASPAAAPAAQAKAPAAAPAPTPAAAGAGKSILSPLPGVIISVDVKQGDSVKRGDKVAVIEAMKMENEILSDCDGTVTAVHVQKGDTVADEAKIVTIG